MTISGKTAQAYKWNSLSQVINQVLLLAINIVLVGILSPEDFGTIALPFLLFSFLRLIQDLGYSDVLLKSASQDKKLHSSIFWLIVLVGLGLSICYYMGLRLLSYTDHQIILAYTTSLIIGSFCIGYESILRKDLSFKKLFFVDLLSNVVSGLVGIWMAYKGYGWMALLMRTIIQYGVSLICYVTTISWQPSRILDLGALAVNKNFAAINIFDQSLAYISKNVDTFIIGLRFDKSQLGLYDRAYKLINLPVQQTAGALSKVMLPEIALQHSTADQSKSILQRNILIASMVILPVSIYLYFSADCIINIVFGSKWLSLTPIFKEFALSAWFQTILSIFNPYMASRDNNKAYLTFSIISKGIIIIGMIILCISSTNLTDIANGYLILNAIVCFIIMGLMHKYYCAGLVNKSFVTELIKILLACVATTVLHYLIIQLAWSCGMQLGSLLLADLVVYIFALWVMKSHILQEVRRMSIL